jgi:hypothetical protein
MYPQHNNKQTHTHKNSEGPSVLQPGNGIEVNSPYDNSTCEKTVISSQWEENGSLL